LFCSLDWCQTYSNEDQDKEEEELEATQDLEAQKILSEKDLKVLFKRETEARKELKKEKLKAMSHFQKMKYYCLKDSYIVTCLGCCTLLFTILGVIITLSLQKQ